MARLLILLVCARAGAAGIMDALNIKAVCEVPTDGGPRKVYLDMDVEAFETLAGPPGPGNAMSLPIEATDCEPFKSALDEQNTQSCEETFRWFARFKAFGGVESRGTRAKGPGRFR